MASAPEPQFRRDRPPVWRQLEAAPPPALGTCEQAPVVIVGAGPIGLALAVDLGQRGHDVLVLGRFDFIPHGSKAICFSKRSLDILDRLGVGEACVAKGVTWNHGKVFWKESREPIYEFDMLPVKNQKMPGFINIQQYYLEDLLLKRISELPTVKFRAGHEVIALDTRSDGNMVEVATAEGSYKIACDWLIACDGSKSFIRQSLGLDFEGRVFEDNFLIADVRMEHEEVTERRFWFDPSFNPGQSALMHKQPDGVWRLDFQLGWGVDRAAAVEPANVERYVRAMLGDDVEFSEEWYSIYTFQCRRMKQFVHDRVIFAGDSAHLVSPFGARGCNGGLADIDNLGWKLDLVLGHKTGPELLDSYNHEAVATADANILASTRSADFLTPRSAVSQTFRNAVLELAKDYPFARGFVNSGRLSVAIPYPESPLNTPDADDWQSQGIAPGHVALDAPLDGGWLLDRIRGHFVLLVAGPAPEGVGVPTLVTTPSDADLRERYGLESGGAYLLRPDQYVAARWKAPTAASVAAALARAKGDML